MWMMLDLVHLSMLLLVPLQQIHSSGISLCGIFSILLKIFWKKEYFLKEKNAKKGKFILKSSQLPTIWKGV